MQRALARGDQKKAAALAAELAGPERPPELNYLWNWYRQLSRERDYAGMGDPLPLKSRDIAAWAGLRRRRLDGWEIDLIEILDAVELAARRGDETEQTDET